MKQLFTIFLLFFSQSSYADYNWKFNRVVDGDTVEFQVSWLPKELGENIKIRVYGVDTPEKPPRAQCDQEAEKALKASEFTKHFMTSGKNIVVQLKGWDKYGGRLLGDVVVDNKSLRMSLIENNLARQYFGDAKQSWCK
jgi:micrococcal nuclease